MKVTKQALTRLNASPVEVRLWNGCFNKAIAKAEFSRYTLELRVEVTHSALQWQCGNKNAIELVYWKGSEGFQLPLPKELLPLVEKLKEAATMTNEEARQLSAENASAFAQAFEELGTVSRTA
jgi:hypothetical protein